MFASLGVGKAAIFFHATSIPGNGPKYFCEYLELSLAGKHILFAGRRFTYVFLKARPFSNCETFFPLK
jgi:hypothetical protein